jgi:hypothetical protein
MDTRKRLFQLWLGASLVWIALTAWLAYTDYTDPIRQVQRYCARFRAENAGSGRVCFEPLVDLVPFERMVGWYVAGAVAPCVVLLLGGLAVFWIRDRLRHSCDA